MRSEIPADAVRRHGAGSQQDEQPDAEMSTTRWDDDDKEDDDADDSDDNWENWKGRKRGRGRQSGGQDGEGTGRKDFLKPKQEPESADDEALPGWEGLIPWG